MKPRLNKDLIAIRMAREINDGDYVNLGNGIPTLVSSYVKKDVIFHCEQGLLGHGRVLAADEAHKWDYDLINATGQFVTPIPGMCIVDHAMAFAIIRGGRCDIAMQGALQVSEKGDLANWTRIENWNVKFPARLGGAMDMVVGPKRIIVGMEHNTKDGKPKVVKKCTYPLTGETCVNLIITDLAVIRVSGEGLLLEEVAPGWTTKEVQANTEAELKISRDLKEMDFGEN